MWTDFAAANRLGGVRHDEFAFGDSEVLADELADLVANGPKRATAGLVADYAADGEPIPEPGAYSVVLDGRGDAVAVIRTTEVRVGPLSTVDEAFAWDEGEGDRMLAGWMRAHTAFFTRRCADLGLEFSLDLPVVFVRFEKVWPAAD